MAQWYGADASLRYLRSSDEFKQQFLQLSDEELDWIWLICGHFDLPFWLQRKLGDRFVISLVRELVERVLYTYRYAKSWKQHPRHGLVEQMSVEEYVNSQFSDATRHNGQCRRLCAAGDFQTAREMALRHIDLLGALELNTGRSAIGWACHWTFARTTLAPTRGRKGGSRRRSG